MKDFDWYVDIRIEGTLTAENADAVRRLVAEAMRFMKPLLPGFLANIEVGESDVIVEEV